MQTIILVGIVLLPVLYSLYKGFEAYREIWTPGEFFVYPSEFSSEKLRNSITSSNVSLGAAIFAFLGLGYSFRLGAVLFPPYMAIRLPSPALGIPKDWRNRNWAHPARFSCQAVWIETSRLPCFCRFDNRLSRSLWCGGASRPKAIPSTPALIGSLPCFRVPHGCDSNCVYCPRRFQGSLPR